MLNERIKIYNNNTATLSAGNTLILDTGKDGIINNISGNIALNSNKNNSTLPSNPSNPSNQSNPSSTSNPSSPSSTSIYDNLIYINTGTLNNITHSQQETNSYTSKNYEYKDISTKIGDTATIQSNNQNSNIIINANSNINLKGADITANNTNSNIQLTAGNNINISTVEDYTFTREYSKVDGGTFGTTTTKENIKQSLTNQESNLTAGGNLTINAGNNLTSIGSNFEAGLNVGISNINPDGILNPDGTLNNGNINLSAGNDVILANAMDYKYEYDYVKKESFDIASAVANITTAIAVGALTGGAGAATMAGVMAGTGATNMTKGSIEQSTEYHEKTLATNLTGNNISITSDNDTTMISANINTENEVKYNIAGNLNISTATEQHISEYNKDEWGGDLSSIGRAIISGAITGAAVGYGMDAGKFLGNLASSSISNGVLSAGVNGAVYGSTFTYSSMVGNSMSQTTLNGGSFGDILASGRDSAISGDTWKAVGITGLVAGASAMLVELAKGSTSLASGGDAVYKPSEKLIDKYPEQFKDYKGVIDSSANNIGIGNTTDILGRVGQPVTPYSNIFDSSFWVGENSVWNGETNFWSVFAKEGGFVSDLANEIPGMNSMSLMHDFWGSNFIINTTPILQITIIPAIAVEYCAISPALCGFAISESINNDYGIKK